MRYSIIEESFAQEIIDEYNACILCPSLPVWKSVSANHQSLSSFATTFCHAANLLLVSAFFGSKLAL